MIPFPPRVEMALDGWSLARASREAAPGPSGTPAAGSERAGVRPGATRAWLVAFLRAGAVPRGGVAAALELLLAAAPVARMPATG